MIIILVDPSEDELNKLKRLVGEFEADLIIEKYIVKEGREYKPEWLSSEEFESEIKKRGYSCKQITTKKRLCDSWGVAYEMRGKNMYYRNDLHRIPSRVRDQS